ncbi:MAG: DUF5665 domain-containing protein [candidate division WOR-3 bacterium]|nr:DUF5665 domain-containing protein [candidate division WOR-3 bacterium]MCX7756712.1 DUF5665 domain-containing protein [candidate division WOR-3 bacterium]MDW7988214.1 DUF5665 domain-containing protein [candidate division WOR-3 bacterium]
MSKLREDSRQENNEEKKFTIKQFDFLGIKDLVAFLKNPTKLFFLNFLAGLGRGFGFALGFTVLAAVVIYLLRRAVSVPVLGNYIAKILEFIETQRQMYR